jgi:AraC-like DNA-binding protein
MIGRSGNLGERKEPLMAQQGPLRFEIPQVGVRVAESVHETGFRMNYESHEFFETYYVYKGRLNYFELPEDASVQEEPYIENSLSVGDKTVLGEGDVQAIGPTVQHRIVDEMQATLLLLCFSMRFMDASPERRELWHKIVEHRPLRTDFYTRELLERSLRRIMAEQNAPRLGSALTIEAEANHLLVTLGQLAEKPPDPDALARVRGVLEALERTFVEPWDLDTAAQRAHLSRRRFSTLFRQSAGCSFVQKLHTLRVTHAAQLMRGGRQTIQGAAYFSGFNDQAHFYHVFKKHFGLAPGEWLRQTGNK